MQDKEKLLLLQKRRSSSTNWRKFFIKQIAFQHWQLKTHFKKKRKGRNVALSQCTSFSEICSKLIKFMNFVMGWILF